VQSTSPDFDGLSLNGEVNGMENHINRALKASLDFESFPEPKIKSVEISFERSPETGLGFNIVGGIKSPHIPGHAGIFVSKIRPDSPAHSDGRLKVGDRIVKVNGISLSETTHDETVEIFRNVEKECHLIVEPDAERILLSEPSSLIMPSVDDTVTARAFGSRCSTPAKSPGQSPQGSRASTPAKSPPKDSKVSPSVTTPPGVKTPPATTKVVEVPPGVLNLAPPMPNEETVKKVVIVPTSSVDETPSGTLPVSPLHTAQLPAEPVSSKVVAGSSIRPFSNLPQKATTTDVDPTRYGAKFKKYCRFM